MGPNPIKVTVEYIWEYMEEEDIIKIFRENKMDDFKNIYIEHTDRLPTREKPE